MPKAPMLIYSTLYRIHGVFVNIGKIKNYIIYVKKSYCPKRAVTRMVYGRIFSWMPVTTLFSISKKYGIFDQPYSVMMWLRKMWNSEVSI